MLIAFVSLEASPAIVVVAVFEPLWRYFFHKISNLAIVIPMLHQTEEAINRSEEVLKLRWVRQPIPLAYSHPTIPYCPVIGIDSIILDMHTKQAHTLGVVLLVSLAWMHHIAFFIQ